MLGQINRPIKIGPLSVFVKRRFKSTDHYPVIGTEQNRNSKQFAVCIL